MKKKESFFINRLESIGFALKGALYLLKTEASIQVQFALTFLIDMCFPSEFRALWVGWSSDYIYNDGLTPHDISRFAKPTLSSDVIFIQLPHYTLAFLVRSLALCIADWARYGAVQSWPRPLRHAESCTSVIGPTAACSGSTTEGDPAIRPSRRPSCSEALRHYN